MRVTLSWICFPSVFVLCLLCCEHRCCTWFPFINHFNTRGAVTGSWGCSWHIHIQHELTWSTTGSLLQAILGQRGSWKCPLFPRAVGCVPGETTQSVCHTLVTKTTNTHTHQAKACTYELKPLTGNYGQGNVVLRESKAIMKGNHTDDWILAALAVIRDSLPLPLSTYPLTFGLLFSEH